MVCGILKKKFGRSNEKDIKINFYKEQIDEMKKKNAYENEIINDWYNCLKELSGKD